MCEKFSMIVEVLQAHLFRRTGDSQYNMRQYDLSLVQDMNPEPPIFETVILPLRPQYKFHTKQDIFCSTMTLATIIDHVKHHRTFT